MPAEVEAESACVMNRLGPDVPLHFTAFHPDWKLTDRPPTPPERLREARRMAANAGLHYVYTGQYSRSGGPDYPLSLLWRDPHWPRLV